MQTAMLVCHPIISHTILNSLHSISALPWVFQASHSPGMASQEGCRMARCSSQLGCLIIAVEATSIMGMHSRQQGHRTAMARHGDHVKVPTLVACSSRQVASLPCRRSQSMRVLSPRHLRRRLPSVGFCLLIYWDP